MSVHIAILFTMMLRHGLLPDGMLFGTMVPISKGRLANLSNSDNFRAITLSSILCKILDIVILTKESNNLCSSNLQFSLKPRTSTSPCTSMVQETISYYVNNGSNVCGLRLDARKAFDRVNYCKIFRILLEKNFVLYIVGCSSMLIKNLGSDGNQPNHLILMLVMVSSREELYHPSYFVYTLMVC